MADSTFNVDTEINDLNGAKGDHKQDLSELEAFTTRINELVANMLKREICLKDELATKKEDIASITTSLENSNKEIAELQNQIAEMRAINEKNQSLIGEYKERIDLLIGELSLLTNQKSESQAEESPELKAETNTTENSVLIAETEAEEENKMLKTDRKAQKKKLKKLLKQNPNANEKILAELLGVDSSYIIGLRKEFDI